MSVHSDCSTLCSTSPLSVHLVVIAFFVIKNFNKTASIYMRSIGIEFAEDKKNDFDFRWKSIFHALLFQLFHENWNIIKIYILNCCIPSLNDKTDFE